MEFTKLQFKTLIIVFIDEYYSHLSLGNIFGDGFQAFGTHLSLRNIFGDGFQVFSTNLSEENIFGDGFQAFGSPCSLGNIFGHGFQAFGCHCSSVGNIFVFLFVCGKDPLIPIPRARVRCYDTDCAVPKD
ncbi:hypothetical protein NPIL_460351 [Nephila pilipes]|uniref:Uncharacterized protein n=1 Tax=Nephila pilipes TaxID=299642 RepID=A0A8X6T9Z5_NEPPI|nr:hypothetical protein NPIL_460351 [Nephila pilipes]